MVTREFIYSVIKSNHVIAVRMKGEKRIDGLFNLVYVIYELILKEDEEKDLITNRINGIHTDGKIRIKAVRTSEVDASNQDSEPQEYEIDTKDIVDYLTLTT